MESLTGRGVELLCLAVGGEHFHLLGRFEHSETRRVIGLAKLHAYHRLSGEIGQRRIWAKRSRSLPIRDRRHQVNVYAYIMKHRDGGAWTWSYREGLYWADESG